jgi:hypothetical protein
LVGHGWTIRKGGCCWVGGAASTSAREGQSQDGIPAVGEPVWERDPPQGWLTRDDTTGRGWGPSLGFDNNNNNNTHIKERNRRESAMGMRNMEEVNLVRAGRGGHGGPHSSCSRQTWGCRAATSTARPGAHRVRDLTHEHVFLVLRAIIRTHKLSLGIGRGRPCGFSSLGARACIVRKPSTSPRD